MKCEANMNNRGKKFGKFLSGSAHQSFLSPMHFTNIFVSFYSPALKQKNCQNCWWGLKSTYKLMSPGH